MNPNAQAETGGQLPPPSFEAGSNLPPQQSQEASLSSGPEMMTLPPPVLSSNNLPQAAAPAPTTTYQPGMPASALSKDDQTSAVIPTTADDTDLIEKEWVVKAKQLIEHTKNDPYQQTKAVGKLKADYLKKRYNKDIKVSED